MYLRSTRCPKLASHSQRLRKAVARELRTPDCSRQLCASLVQAQTRDCSLLKLASELLPPCVSLASSFTSATTLGLPRGLPLWPFEMASQLSFYFLAVLSGPLAAFS